MVRPDLRERQLALIRQLEDLWRQKEERLVQEIQNRDRFIAELLQSRSWQITAPLREVHKILFPGSLPVQPAPPVDSDSPPSIAEAGKQIFAAHAKIVQDYTAESACEAFIASQMNLCFPRSPNPELAILMVLHNRSELTFRCLLSLALSTIDSMQLLIVDNGSTDHTSDLLQRVKGATIIRNQENLHFLAGANQAAKVAEGKYLLFLNNDTVLLPGAIESALNVIRSDDRIGAVGGKLIFPDGTLQEAGGVVWPDGVCAAYGRGGDPFLPQYMFRRDVQYCSGAFLLTRRDTFLENGGFDEEFKPAYYEDVDYCLRLRENGLRVVFDPTAVVVHQEFGSSSIETAIQLQSAHRSILVRKRKAILERDAPPENMLEARFAGRIAHKVLLVDSHAPHRYLGAGYPRANAIVSALLSLNCSVTMFPADHYEEEWTDLYADIPREVEVMRGFKREDLPGFLSERRKYYCTILCSRDENIRVLSELVRSDPSLFEGTKIIFDAEALSSLREAGRLKVSAQQCSEDGTQSLLKQELKHFETCHAVIAVSEQEKRIIAEETGIKNISVISYAIDPLPTARSFGDRNGFLFAGNIQDDIRPNTDAVVWFGTEIWPLVRRELPESRFIIAGRNYSEKVKALESDCVKFTGCVPDLQSLYNRVRVFVAPSRFAAGIPIKILDAVAHGVPVVATSLLEKQLDWTSQNLILTADSPAEFSAQCVRLHQDATLWEDIRLKGLECIRSKYSFDLLRNHLISILDQHEPS